MHQYIELNEKTRFVFPIDGDCLNEFDGEKKDGKIFVEVKLQSDKDLEINGIKAGKKGGYLTAKIGLSEGKNTIIAKGEGVEKSIDVYCFEKAVGGYRLSSDDNIIFLWDINKHKDEYKSIFDNPYLAVYKKAHDLYGACVHLNIYYEMPEHPDFTEKRDFFDLSMMTDKFKSEWKANSSWLKLNFHAKADKPDKPYIDTDYSRIYNDCKKVQEEIVRFAGEDTLSKETTVHWGACTEEGVKAVRDLGIKSLAGYFKIEGSKTVVSDYFPKYLVDYLSERDFWYDREHDMMYAKIDRVLNLHEAEESVELLEVGYARKNVSGFIELMMHEEYFYPDYASYEPDFENRVLFSCKWAKEHGYVGRFLDDIR